MLAACARAVDRRLDALGLAPPPFDPPPEVRDDLRGVFGPAIDPAKVVIRSGHVPGAPHQQAFAPPGLIYLGADPGVVGGTRVNTGRPRATPTLLHELVRVWQGQYLGPGNVVTVLVEQARYGRSAYDWRATLNRVPGNGVRRDFPVEVHAQGLQIMQEGLAGLSAGRASTWRGERFSHRPPRRRTVSW